MRKAIHKFILWYVTKKCGGAFHTGPYGEKGHYIKVFTDNEYGELQKFLIRHENMKNQ